jgi:vitamin B12/bleomycin/antimicrobial peptide transport system ATP-binding/permease protein
MNADNDSTGRTLRRVGRAVRVLVASEHGPRAVVSAASLLLLLLVINGLNVVNSYVGRDFITAIERRDSREFIRMTMIYAGVFALLTVAAVTYRFTEERLGLLWREWLTRNIVNVYLGDHLYYRLAAGGGLTNPDQRIADDIRSFTASTLSLALTSLNGLFTIAAFAGVLWSISRPLFATAVIYASAGSVLAYAFGRPLLRLNYVQSDAEADFRDDLVHLRQNAEAVALLHREPHMKTRLQHDLTALTRNLERIIAVNRNLGFFTTGYNYFVQLIPVLIVAPLFIRGEADFGVISQSAMAFAHLVGAFSLVINQFPQLSSYGAVLARLSALDAATISAPPAAAGVTIVEHESRFAFERVTLRWPEDGSLLVRDLSFEVPRGAHVVARVPSAAAAMALERTVVGIWPSGEGILVRPPLGRVLLIPDRPYLPPATLRELLVGDHDQTAPPDADIYDVLSSLGVANVVERVERAGGLDMARDWADLLSLEDQRLVDIARLAIAGPSLAILTDVDELLGAERAGRVRAMLASRDVALLELRQKNFDGRDRRHFAVEISADGSWKQIAEVAVPARLDELRATGGASSMIDDARHSAKSA